MYTIILGQGVVLLQGPRVHQFKGVRPSAGVPLHRSHTVEATQRDAALCRLRGKK